MWLEIRVLLLQLYALMVESEGLGSLPRPYRGGGSRGNTDSVLFCAVSPCSLAAESNFQNSVSKCLKQNVKESKHMEI